MKTKWIINRQDDLIWLVGSATSSFIIVALFYILVEFVQLNVNSTIFILYMVWALLFDSTHLFATYTRTYFDPVFRQDYPSLVYCSPLVIFIAPGMALGYYFLAGDMAAYTFVILFLNFALFYAYYHLARQHWGFVALYAVKNEENSPIGRKSDAALMFFGLAYPFINFMVYKLSLITILSEIPLASWATVWQSFIFLGTAGLLVSQVLLRLGKLTSYFIVLLSNVSFILLFFVLLGWLFELFGLKSSLAWITQLFLVGFIMAILGAFIQLIHAIYNKSFNTPKCLLIAIVLITHNAILLLPLPFMAIIMALTLFHNLQYHRIIRFYNTNKYTNPNTEYKYGFAVKLTKKMFLLTVFAFLFSMPFTALRLVTLNITLTELTPVLLKIIVWGVAFHHYILDANIWRVRHNQNLKHDLKLTIQN